ncbi:MAG: SCO family protein [Sphingomonadales bacterium]|nr:SCO family protein [Sphingomonadales bacterium]
MLLPLLQASAAQQEQGAPDFAYPRPGSYQLYRIFKPGNFPVLENSRWLPSSLRHYTSGKITVLSFFYSTCRDPQGCPSLWSVFQTIHDNIERSPDLHGRARLVFLSLDPRVDTPETLSLFASAMQRTRAIVPWHFLTTWSDWVLSRVLSSFGQSAARDVDAEGNPALTISHQVKVYLIDKEGWVREIYTSSSILPDVVEADIRTLLMEDEGQPSR